MQGLRITGLLILSAILIVLATSSQYSNQITGIDSATFEGRDVLVIRTSSPLVTPNGYRRDPGQSTVSFMLSGIGADEVRGSSINMELIREVTFAPVDGKGTEVSVRLASPALVDGWLFRLNQPSDHVILFEVFPGREEQRSARLISDIEGQLGIQPIAPRPAAPPAPPEPEEFDADQLGIPTLDLTGADPQRVMGLAAKFGLVDTRMPVEITTERMGSMTVSPGGLSLASWTSETPPGELYLSGTPSQIARFMASADPETIARTPTIEEVWTSSNPRLRTHSGPSPATRSRLRDDPYAGFYYAETAPNSGTFLSDIRVTLPATSGLNLYDVLNYLSQVSGISIIIDPYTFDEPTGMRRDPLPPDQSDSNSSGPGFRPAGVFDPTFAGSGTVQGNLIDVPFDTALKLILDTHGLKFMVYDGSGGTSKASGQLGTRASREGGADPYAQPIILVTSRERLEQELPGSNEVNLQQFHYADPYQISEMLDNLNMLPSSEQGWYIYDGGGNGFGGGGRGGGGNNGGGNGGGGRGLYSAKGGLLVYRGSTRQPVYSAVADAAKNGDDIIKVLLTPETGDNLVTAFAEK